MARLPTYHLIAKSNTVADATWFSRYGGDSYLWGGTLVYDGKVYDHIRYRMRGGVWRYSMVKNMWKFDFNRGHDLEARDNWGKKYSVPWRKLNLGACIQQADGEHRGEQGMFESVGSRFFELAGVESFKTTFSTFRVIDSAQELAPGDQYEGDFWGLYLSVEQEDGRFLDEHGLPDSNFYKMEGGTGELNNQGPNGAGDKSDLNYILSNYTGATDQWWRTNWNLLNYYSYQAIVQGIHHFDIAYDKNYFYYYNSATRLWQVMSWDLDLTWAHNMYDPGDAGIDRLAERILTPARESGTGAQSGTSVMRLTGSRPAFEIEFRNRVREIRDLLFNSDQGWKLIDEYASLVRGVTNSPSILDADRSQWDYNPKMADGAYTPNVGKAGQGRYYQFPLESRTNAALKGSFNATVQIMKNYIGIRGELLDTLATDRAIPLRPDITYTGPDDYPINRLTFQCSHYMSPSNYPFASMRWRLGEVTDTSSPSYNPSVPHKYEIETVWDSGPISVFSLGMTVPSSAVRPGQRYRLRVQFTDNTGRNSSWSQHIEFTCGVQENVADLMNYLRITELMYNPPPGGYEYIELHNFSTTATLDLGGVRFTDGIEFTFPNGTFLGPNAYLVLIDTTNTAAFRAYYKLTESVSLIWAFTKSFDNKGEQVTLKTSAGGSNIVSFTYGDGRGWPRTADGSGNSLILLDSALADQANGSGEYGPNWRSSTYLLGSPGRADPIPPAAPIVLNEIAANTDSTDVFTSNDWIELYNPNDFPVVLGANWYLSDDDADLKKWMIPSNTVVPARGWISFDEQTGFHNPTNIGFGLSSGGEQVFLSCLPGTEENRIVDFVSFKGQEPGWTLGRYPDGAGNWCSLQPATRDMANAAPPSHVVINELMYHPPDKNGLDNVVDEFVELWNPTQSEVHLWNTNGVWRFDGGLTMAFPSNTVLAAGEYLIVVSFDPGTNAAQVEAFKSLYGITDPAVKILGPYLGKLANSSDRVALEKPQASETPGNPSWVVVDEVIYADQSPWPCGSDGTGTSLQRVSADGAGNDPLNWTAQAPTPGLARVPQPPGAPTIVAQPVSASAALNGSAWFDVRVCGTPPYTYQWQFNDADIPNATNSTLVLNNLQITNGGLYTVRVSNEGGSALSAPALLTLAYPPVITLQPLDQVAGVGGSASFTVAAEGSAPLRYQWRVNGTNIPGGTNSTLLLDAIKATDQGNYCALVINNVGTAISSNAMLTVLLPPTISRDPQSAIVVGSTNSLTFGQSFSNVTFFVAASGTHPLAYQWRLNGVEIPFATNSFLRITNASIPDEGIYDVTISNIVGIITSAPAPLVISMVPVITLAPEHFTVAAGSTVALSAAAKGNPLPFNFKWTKDGLTVTNMLLTETNCSLLLANIQPAQGGNYQVVVNNSFETNRITTTPRRIVVVVTPPTNQMVVPGQTVTISAVASAGPWTSRVRYQWQFDGANILNATNSVLSLTNFLPTQEGLYTISVNNPSNVIGNFSAQISIDTDHDGMPDAWETAHQFLPGDPSDASADADHDGMTNLQEYTAGTDPLDAQSFLRLDIQAGEGVILRFNAVSNRVYAIEYSDRIRGLWTKLVDVPVAATNRLFEGYDTSGETNRYYRLQSR